MRTLGREVGVQSANGTVPVLTAVGRLTTPRVSLTPASAVICGGDLPLMSGYSPICPCGFQFRIISDSGCNYSDITSNKDPDITPSCFTFTILPQPRVLAVMQILKTIP